MPTMDSAVRSFSNGKFKVGDVIHIRNHITETGKPWAEVWMVEWDDSVGKFYAYNQLNSSRDFQIDILEDDGIHEDRLFVKVSDGYVFYPEVLP